MVPHSASRNENQRRNCVVAPSKEYITLGISDRTDLLCAVSTLCAGNMSLLYGNTKDSLRKREIFFRQIGIDYREIVCADQVHGTRVALVIESDKGKGALSYESSIQKTDALVTNKKNVAICVHTADCLPIFLYDSVHEAIGLIHAGWRSTKENIFLNTLNTMKGSFGTQAQDLTAGFGPAIRKCCYEVGHEFRDLFAESVVDKDGRYYLDLCAENKRQMFDAGVNAENIQDCAFCTACRSDYFFSYRRQGLSSGRMISVAIMLNT